MKKINNLLVYERAKEEAKYIIDRKVTVRQAASNFKISKSTIHKDVTKVLENNHDPLALEVREVLEKNLTQIDLIKINNIRNSNFNTDEIQKVDIVGNLCNELNNIIKNFMVEELK